MEALDAGTADARQATYRILSSGYFQALGLHMRQGREFSDAETESGDAPRVAIMRRAGRATFPGAQSRRRVHPVRPSARHANGGARASDGDRGVAPPLRQEVTERAAQPPVYVPFGRHFQGEMHLHVKVADALDSAVVLGALRDELRATGPGLPLLALTTMQAFHDRSLQLWVLRAGGVMFVGLGLLALGLAVVGVYGVKSYVVSSRTREIGIRMALGAQARDVVWLILRDGGALPAAGLVLGLPLAIGVAFTLRFVMAGFTGFEPLVFAGAIGLLAASALAASYVPAHRATRIAPLAALRTE